MRRRLVFGCIGAVVFSLAGALTGASLTSIAVFGGAGGFVVGAFLPGALDLMW